MRISCKKLFLVICLLMACLVSLGLNLPVLQAAVDVPSPPPVFYVLDQAGVLSPTAESKIAAIGQELAAKTKAQVVAVTLKSSQQQPLEDLGLAILRGWGVGDKQLNNGVVLLVIPDEKKSRIEVGYGLEGRLPDGKTGRIQDEYMLPYFREGQYETGILSGYTVLAQEAASEYGVTLNVDAPRPVATAPAPSKELATWQIVLIVVGLIILFLLDYYFLGGFLFGFLLSMLFRGGGGGFGGGSSGGGGSGGGGGSSRDW